MQRELEADKLRITTRCSGPGNRRKMQMGLYDRGGGRAALGNTLAAKLDIVRPLISKYTFGFLRGAYGFNSLH